MNSNSVLARQKCAKPMQHFTLYGKHPYDGHAHPFLCCASMKIYRKTYLVKWQ